MSGILLTILKMSLTASIATALIVLARQLLKKAPKIFSYVLWAVVFFRLLCPISFESPLSIVPPKVTAYVTEDIFQPQESAVEENAESPVSIDSGTRQTTGHLVQAAEQKKVTPLQLMTAIWLLGFAILLIRAAISYVLLKRKISTAIRIEKNIYETDRIKGAFVLGFIHPKIFIPAGLADTQKECVVMHELTHIRRGDHLLKPLAFLALAVHWFNPVVWLAYFLCVKDMEMSCDESVLRNATGDIRASYSHSLLAMSMKQSGIPFPVAFGESRTKSRIKNVLNYKRPALWIITITSVAVMMTIIVLAANPKKVNLTENNLVSADLPAIKNVSPSSSSDNKLDWRSIPNSVIETLFKDQDIKITSYRKSKEIYLIDFAAEKGTEIYAPKAGKVTLAEWNGSYGNCAIIDHGDGIESRYGHCSKLLVAEGDAVEVGTLIAEVGSTGNSTGPHLHFEVYENGVSIDPVKLFEKLPSNTSTRDKETLDQEESKSNTSSDKMVKLNAQLIPLNAQEILFKRDDIKVSGYIKRDNLYSVDFAAKKGTEIYAPVGGTVTFSAWKDTYGYFIIIEHDNGIQTTYGHCSKLLVAEGEAVEAGTLIAEVGSTGNSTGPHLHFEVYENGVSIDPVTFFKE